MTLSEELKIHTAGAHRDIEQVAVFKELMSEMLTLDGYRNVLERWYAFIYPLEIQLRNLAGIYEVLPCLNERFKTELLQQDLSSSGKVPDSTRFESCLPECQSVEEALGVLYVMEGSTLGSQFIVKKLKTHPFITDQIVHYYSGYGPRTGSQWKTFKERLNRWGEDHKDKKKRVLESALNCFNELMRHMDQEMGM